MSKSLKNVKRSADRDNTVSGGKKTEEIPMGFHRFFQMLKIVMGVFQLFSVIQILMDGNISGLRIVDLLFYAVFAALLLASAFLHQKKTGVYLFFAYGIIELFYAMANVFVSAGHFGFTEDIFVTLLSYAIGSAVLLIPVYLYYKRRMHLLK
ncbi:MAG: hypothetical protein E7190_07630 [Erysipelotrichaceae bacterium]|nr:hypothetical protein [Erysipelotrichaceae bacterium]